MPSSNTLPSIEKLRWQCRRGMLELDYALSDFLEQQYPNLAEEEQALFVRLLDFEDQLLLDWLMGNVVPSDDWLRDLVERIARRS
ncbi:succinate dehydrogenase assembly factor 2 [Solemya velesiana gill symbiont]|nr:succinate dehydrogenase assembly factor 2 [Solemya velesiana gill symbiont]